jgi:hypothetical protein
MGENKVSIRITTRRTLVPKDGLLIAVGAGDLCGSFCGVEPVDSVMFSCRTRLIRNGDSSQDIKSKIPSSKQLDRIRARKKIADL